MLSMGKSTISTGPCPIANYVQLPEGSRWDIHTRWCPPVISWFITPLTIDISPTKTIVIGVINQLSYRTGAPPCSFMMFARSAAPSAEVWSLNKKPAVAYLERYCTKKREAMGEHTFLMYNSLDLSLSAFLLTRRRVLFKRRVLCFLLLQVMMVINMSFKWL